MMHKLLRLFAIAACASLITNCSGAKSTLPITTTPSGEARQIETAALTPNASAPTHVLTSDYMFSDDNVTTHGRPFSAYSSSLTWGETYAGTAAHNAGIKTIYYSNPNRETPGEIAIGSGGESLYPTTESAFAHTCSNARIYEQRTTKYYLTNPNSPVMVNLYKTVVASVTSQQHFDLIFDDEPFDFAVLSGMPCNFVASTWLGYYEKEIAAVGHPILFNGLGVLGPNNTLSASFPLTSVTSAGMAENCYGTHFGSPLKNGSYWVAMENTELKMAAINKMFLCYSSDLQTATTAQAARTYVYASFLLTYNPNTSVFWEYFLTHSGYHVEPESKLVPLSPVVAAPATVASLHLSTGVYGREYAACYLGGTAVGKCAVVVNSDASGSHAFPYHTYHHTLKLTGGGILDGGTVSTNGPAPPASVAATSAVIALP